MGKRYTPRYHGLPCLPGYTAYSSRPLPLVYIRHCGVWVSREESLGFPPSFSLGEEVSSLLPRGVSVTVSRREESGKPPDQLGERNEKIGWTNQ